MNNTAWFYVLEEERKGPVSIAELQSLVNSATLVADDLVWNSSLPDWIEVASVPDLNGHDATLRRAKDKATHLMQGLKRDTASDSHFLDVILRILRSMISDESLASINRSIFSIGYIALFAFMALSLAYGVLMGIRLDRLSPMFYGLLGALAGAVLQFTAKKMFRAFEAMISNTPSRLSPAFPDCFAMFCVFSGGASLLWAGWVAFQTNEWSLLIPGIGGAIVLEVLAIVSMHPKLLNAVFTLDLSAGEEAVGIFSFLLKALIRLVLVTFGVGTSMGTLGFLGAVLMYFKGSTGQMHNLSSALANATLVVAAGSAPLLSYLFFLWYYLGIDVVSAVLAVPRKLDARAAGRKI